MKGSLLLACVLCLALCGVLFAVSRTAAQSSFAAYADAASSSTCCEIGSCGCLGMKCACGDCGGK